MRVVTRCRASAGAGNYSTTRFPFSWAWWSAYGWKRHITGPGGKGEPSPDDLAAAEGMKLTNQMDCYNGVGLQIKENVLDGKAVVMFAYGLSGSGKTFTVFGPDAVDSPDAW